jgi:hypothetical protein
MELVSTVPMHPLSSKTMRQQHGFSKNWLRDLPTVFQLFYEVYTFFGPSSVQKFRYLS